MKESLKLLRVGLAAALGSVLWAGCTAPRFAVQDEQTVEKTPIDLTKRRPDTHPELRPSMWQMYGPEERGSIYPRVVATTVIDSRTISHNATDETHLLPYNPEAVNIALGEADLARPMVTSQGIVVEAAGAEPGPDTYFSWRDRVLENKRRLERAEP